MQRAPKSYYHQQGNYQHNYQWRPYKGPGMHHQQTKFNVHHNVTSNLEYERHWCETCDREFPTLESLEKHKLQHQKCNIDGCQFIAHPKVITKHIQMQHSTGLYKRIAKLNNPEEIKKWIEERKKKYPTKLNIDKKVAQVKEKIERGEKMGLQIKERHKYNSSGIPSKRKHNFNNDQCHKKNRRNNFGKPKRQYEVDTFQKQLEPKDIHNNILLDYNRKLKPFAGIQNIDMENDKKENVEQPDNVCLLIDEDCEENSEVNVVPNPQEPTVCSALSALIFNYESSDGEAEEIKEHKLNSVNTTDNPKKEKECKSNKQLTTDKLVVQKRNNDNKNGDTEYSSKLTISEQRLHEVPTMSANEIKLIEYDKSDNDSGPEEVKVIKSTALEMNINKTQTDHNDIPETVRKITTNNNLKKRVFNKPKPKLPSTLLQKLLHREMQHERNIILQCIRYIVINNYFNKS